MCEHFLDFHVSKKKEKNLSEERAGMEKAKDVVLQSHVAHVRQALLNRRQRALLVNNN